MKDSPILIVDDNPEARELYRRYLDMEGYKNITVAQDGAEACIEMEFSAFDLVLTDLKMVPVDGMSVLKAVRESNPEIRVIIVTGHATVGSAVEALRLGAADYILKPVDRVDLCNRVRNCLENLQLKRLNEKTTADLAEANKQLTIFSKAIEQSQASIMMTNKQGYIEYINDSFTQSTGYKKEDVIGKKPQFLKSGKHTPSFYKRMWETILSGDEWRSRICNKKKNGNLIWELQSISPIKNEKDETTHFLSVKLDDSKRKFAEDKLKDYAQELEKRNQDLQVFSFMASRDLKEALQKIVLFGEHLKDAFENLGDQDLMYLSGVQMAAERLQGFVDDLILFSQVTTRAPNYQVVDLRNIVEDIVQGMHRQVKRNQGLVQIKNLPIIETDEFQIRQLFQCLIENALKFHKQKITPSVTIDSRIVNKTHWEIQIQDNGIGFDPEDGDRIFKPFERLNSAKNFSGTGMGLAICKKIVEKQGGSISVHSIPDKGSVFSVALPVRSGSVR